MDMSLPDSDFDNSPFEFQQEPEVGLHDLVIEVLGTQVHITADKDPAYLNEVLAQYRLAVANTQNVLAAIANGQNISNMKDSPLKVAILTGFLLCDEINEQKIQNEKERVKTEKTLDNAMQDIITRIDQLLE